MRRMHSSVPSAGTGLYNSEESDSYFKGLELKRSCVCFRLFALLAASLPFAAIAQRMPIQIHADLTEAPRKIFRADVDLPVHGGAVDLITPEWIPGAHGPDGPILSITGIRFETDGKVLPWHRDPVDVFEYHLEVPAGATMLHAHLDCVGSRHGTGNSAVLEWEGLLLYPAHTPVREIAIQPTVTVPKGWGIGTSLNPVTPYDPQHPVGGTIQYAPTTVELLEDSPVFAAQYFHEYSLAPGVNPKHYMDVIGPTAASVEVNAQALDQLSHLVRESIAMYGPPHYTSYHFLVSMVSGRSGWGGLEHHESSDNTVPEGFFESAAESYTGLAGLLPHEFTHSWNGKFRRPDGLATPDYATPMQNNLLWVYEGLTNYLGDVLGERVGTISAAQYRQELALITAQQDTESGRAWRSVEDTTFTDAMPRNGSSRGGGWGNWKRSTDYYPEGSIFWLDVDTTIRRLTGEKKGLHDFLSVFLQKGKAGVVRVEPYTLGELEHDLNQVAPNDWAGFIKARLYDVQPHVNTEGIEQGGYRLEYTAEPTPELKRLMGNEASVMEWFSIGLDLSSNGTINDVRVGSAADTAQLSPGQKLAAINGKVFSSAALTEVIRSKGPLQLMVQDGDDVRQVTVTYRDGLRYPRLTRMEGTPDRLGEILTPLTPAQP